MALRRVNHSRKHFLLAPRPFSSSSSSKPPFPPPPPRSDDPNASPHPRSSPGTNPGEGPNPAAYSLFQGIRERLQSTHTPPPPRRVPITPPRHAGQSSPTSLQDVQGLLRSYNAGSRNTGGASSHPSSPAGAPPSFQDLLRNSAAPAPPQGRPNSFSFGFDAIRESLHKVNPQQQQRPLRSPKPFLSPTSHDIFAKEQRERDGKPQGVGKEEDSGIVLARDYSYEELGKRLVELRPAGAEKDGKEWFSLEELQGRIAKLAEWEKKQEDPRLGGQYASLRSSLLNIKNKEEDSRRSKRTMQGLSMLTSFGGQSVPEYLRFPPQEELVERYFHPDHMSSEEKMKLELQRVRDEFKMSENDCGSARVQIAQLTLKIKHLSAVLHKKDKHSRKGLQDMVQRRKKYLKYLRRTDWDSYCLVLSKLGLRDVPEYKAPDYKKTQPTTKAKSKKSKSKRKKKMKA